MGPVRILILAVALAAAIGAVVVVRGMSKAQAPAPTAAVEAAPPPKPAAMVLVAKRDLQPGVRLTAADLTWQAWPEESLNPAFIVQGRDKPAPKGEPQKLAATATDIAKAAVGAPDDQAAALAGAVVREAILANEPVTERKLVRAGAGGVMAVALESGMRAIAVPLSAESAAGGFILPGDHVDVVQSREAASASGDKRYVSETVLKNVKVLAIDQTTTAPDGSAVVGATATLAVTPNQAEVLVLSKAQGQLTLVLRSYADAAGPPVTVASGGSGFELPFRASVVRVYKNGQPSEVTVTR